MNQHAIQMTSKEVAVLAEAMGRFDVINVILDHALAEKFWHELANKTVK